MAVDPGRRFGGGPGWSRRQFVRRGSAAGALGALALAGCSSSNKNNTASVKTTATSAGAAAGSATRAATGAPAAGASAAASTSATRAAGTAAPSGRIDIRGQRFLANAIDPAQTLQPKRGGRLTVPAQGDARPASFDPTKSNSTTVLQYLSIAHSRLLRPIYLSEAVKGGKDHFDFFEFVTTPELAASVESPDGLSHTFKLRPNAKWIDKAPVSGRAVTADDVVYSMNKFKAGVLGGEFLGVDSFAASAPDTFVVKMKQPNPDLYPGLFGNYVAVILAPEVEKMQGGFDSNIIGSGPFMLDKITDTVISYKPNPNYFNVDVNGGKYPYLDEVDFLIVTGGQNGQAALQAFVGGQADGTNVGGAKQDVDDMKKAVPSASILERDHWVANFHIAFPLSTPPFNDPRVRQAVAQAIDQPALNNLLYGGDAAYIGNIPWTTAYDPIPTSIDQVGTHIKRNVQGAKDLLKAAGMANGLTFDLTFFEYGGLQPQMEAIKSQLADAGITMNIRKIEFADYFPAFQKGTFTTPTLGSILSSLLTLNGHLFGGMHTGASNNFWKISDPDIDKWTEQQSTLLDPKARRAITKQIWDKDLDQMWRLPLPQQHQRFAYSKGVNPTAMTLWNWGNNYASEYLEQVFRG